MFELRQPDASDGGFLALAPNALRVLHNIGVYDRIFNQGYNYEEINFVSARNLGVLGTVRTGSQEQYGFKTIRVGRHIVRQALLEELKKQQIDIRYGAKCVGVEENEQGATVKFADGVAEKADFVVAADGIHSRLRKYIDPTSEPVFSGQIGMGGFMERAKLEEPDLYMPCMIIGKNNSFAMMPCNHDGSQVGFFATVEERERSREEWNAIAADREQLSKILKERHLGTQWPEVVNRACEGADSSSLAIWP